MYKYKAQIQPDYLREQNKIEISALDEQRLIEDLENAFKKFGSVERAPDPKNPGNFSFETPQGTIFLVDQSVGVMGTPNSFKIYVDGNPKFLNFVRGSLRDQGSFEIIPDLSHPVVEGIEREGYIGLVAIVILISFYAIRAGLADTAAFVFMVLFYYIVFGGALFVLRRLLQLIQGRKFLDPFNLNLFPVGLALLFFIMGIITGFGA